MNQRHQSFAFALLRISLGVNLLGHGFFRILSGVGPFATGVAQGMTKGPLPHSLSLGFGYAIPWLELTLGLLLTAGLWTRAALAGGAVFMIVLTVGTTSIQNWNGAGTQLQYSLVFFVLLWLADADGFCLDVLLRKRNV